MTDKMQPPSTAWKPGQSGNPDGRPPGTGEIAKLRAVISERVPELLAALIDRALAGDTAAARLLLERSMAPYKGIEPPQAIDLPGGTLTHLSQLAVAFTGIVPICARK